MFSTPPKTRVTTEGPPKPRETSTAALARVPPVREGYVRRLSGELESLSTAARVTPPTAAAPRLLEKTVTKSKAPALTNPLANNTTLNKKVLFAESQRVVEAKELIKETKRVMSENTNMKRDVKARIHECLEALLRMIKESEEEKGVNTKVVGKEETVKHIEISEERRREEKKMVKLIEGHAKILNENKEEIKELKEIIGRHVELTQGSYASVAAGPPRVKPVVGTAVHSVVVSSHDDEETSEDVLGKIREAINAREEGMKIESIRKAKDCKVIIGCRTREEIVRVKEKIKTAGKNLCVAEVTNKDPLVILKDVMSYNKDEQVVEGLRAQNREMFEGIGIEDNRIEIKYRKKTRNPHTEHIVLKVSPKLWKRLTDAGKVHIDLQRVKVADHSPLIQCARCLGYGHGKRLCQDPVDVCSHCGGPHLRSVCTKLAEGSLPRCVNCVGAKLERVDHNAFSEECPIRRRWDTLARSTVQYC